MLGVSHDFAALVQGPHHSVCVVEVYQNDTLVKTLIAHDGSVDADKNNAILRRFDAKVTDPTGELTPEGIRDLLAPFGTVIKLYRGVKIPVIVPANKIFDTKPDWNAGTRFHTSISDDGDLVLGNI